MTATAATIGYNAQIKLGNGASPEVFTAISEQASIGGLQIQLDRVEATHLTSPNRKKEYVSGIGDYQDLSVKCNMTRANFFVIKAYIDAGSAADFKIVYPTPLLMTFTFSGVPRALEIGEATPAGLMYVTFKIAPTGDFTVS